MGKVLSAPVALAAVLALALVAAFMRSGPERATASSHREAPLISEDPSADNTDLYAFRSQDRPNDLTVISNWIPGEDPAAGPNYYRFSANARYNIYVDRNGDGKPDVTYRFRFAAPAGPYFLGKTDQPYTVTKVVGGRATVIARGTTPPDNVGPRTLANLYGTSDYASLRARAVVEASDGTRVFAGQRDDGFFGDIGQIFDLLGFRRDTGSQGGGKDFFAGYGVHTISLQIPISQIATQSPVVGVWSSTDRLQATVKGKNVTRRWVQVSRIGNPLVNEVIIPTKLKDLWNRLTPASDSRFAQYYREPILAAVMNQLYHVNAPEQGRDDLVSILLTGLQKPSLNYTGPKLVDELRVNLAIAPTAPVGQGNRFGVVGGDLAGFPNGRRLEDDVVDIAERAVAGALKGNSVPLGDGVDANDVPFLNVFPYQADPFSGAANTKGEQKP
jgi:hypothetical protein